MWEKEEESHLGSRCLDLVPPNHNHPDDHYTLYDHDDRDDDDDDEQLWCFAMIIIVMITMMMKIEMTIMIKLTLEWR